MLDAHRPGSGRAGGFHAHSVAGVRGALRGPHAQYPPVAAARDIAACTRIGACSRRASATMAPACTSSRRNSMAGRSFCNRGSACGPADTEASDFRARSEDRTHHLSPRHRLDGAEGGSIWRDGEPWLDGQPLARADESKTSRMSRRFLIALALSGVACERGCADPQPPQALFEPRTTRVARHGRRHLHARADPDGGNDVHRTARATWRAASSGSRFRTPSRRRAGSRSSTASSRR